VVCPIGHETFGNGAAIKAAAERVEEEVERVHVDMECMDALFGALPHFPRVQIDSLAPHLSWDLFQKGRIPLRGRSNRKGHREEA
jgi:hypothetical protein